MTATHSSDAKPARSRAWRWGAWLGALAILGLGLRLGVPAWCGRDAPRWYDGDPALQRAFAAELVEFEAHDSADRKAHTNRFAGEWALVTHQMVALGLAQLCLAHPAWKSEYAPVAKQAALRSFLPEMRAFGTEAWRGEDALSTAALAGPHGHAYLGYSALALGMARLVNPPGAFPPQVIAAHDALIAAYVRRLAASPTGLIETYPGEAYPTDVAAVAAAIAVHARVTGVDRSKVLAHWVERVRHVQIDRASGLLIQRMGARDGKRHDAPRGSGTGLAAYFASFVDRALAAQLTDALLRSEATFAGFGGVREYASGHGGDGDVDSGPVILGVSVSATGFAIASARAFGRREAFTRIYRTVDLFGVPSSSADHFRFRTGGRIGNALMFAFLTSGPQLELARR